jgi:probable HAF family extracellular repeat protein
MRIRLVLPSIAGVLAVSALVVSPAPAATAAYTVRDLGSLGFGVTKGLAINATGQVTGLSYSSKAFQVSCPPAQYGGPKKCFENPYHAFLWRSGMMTDLGTLGGHFSQGNSINRSGEVVGTADKTSKSGAYLGSDGFLWTGTTPLDLGLFYPAWINDTGDIAGHCETTAGCVLDGTTCASGAACVLTNGTFTQLPNPPGIGCGAAIAINNSGEVLGACGDSQSDSRAAVWENGRPVDLGTLGGAQTSAAALNNLGQVVGWSGTSNGAVHPFLWQNGTMTDLGVSFFPAAINDHGAIVGDEYVYDNGALHDLNTLIPSGTTYQIQYATAINNNGQIVAQAYDTATNQTHTIVLTPN